MIKLKRIGRGLGSGRGKTSGRGTKGQLARGKMPLAFSGSNLPLYKKLPLRKGFGNSSRSSKTNLLSLSDLSIFKTGSIIDIASLTEAKLLSSKDAKLGIKILSRKRELNSSDGEVKVKLKVQVPTSKSAKQKIEQAGGQVDA